MVKINPYLNFGGNCFEAFEFYKSIFGGEFPYVGRFSDMPPQEGMPELSQEDSQKIMHISLPVGQDMLMGSDTGGEWAPPLATGNNVHLSISTDSREEADRIFNALAEGGKITMPLADTFWGDYFGMLTDRFGINWMMSYNANPQQK